MPSERLRVLARPHCQVPSCTAGHLGRLRKGAVHPRGMRDRVVIGDQLDVATCCFPKICPQLGALDSTEEGVVAGGEPSGSASVATTNERGCRGSPASR